VYCAHVINMIAKNNRFRISARYNLSKAQLLCDLIACKLCVVHIWLYRGHACNVEVVRDTVFSFSLSFCFSSLSTVILGRVCLLYS